MQRGRVKERRLKKGDGRRVRRKDRGREQEEEDKESEMGEEWLQIF